jgi:ribosomal protein S27AE
MARLPDASDDGDGCAVCGFTLDAKAETCSMCGAPRLAVSEAAAFRCPFCAEPIPVDSETCPKCGRDLVARHEADTLSVRCPRCGDPAEDRDVCGSCGLVLFVAAQPEPPAPDAITCPTCRTPATEDDVECGKCGTALWHLSGDQWRQVVREALGAAEVELSLSLEESWIDVSAAESLLAEARASLESEKFPRALRTARASASQAQGSRVQAKMLLDAFRAATAKLENARSIGAEIGHCERSLREARESRVQGDFRAAVQAAIRARVCAEDADERMRSTRKAA